MLLEEDVGDVLVRHRGAHLVGRREQERGLELRAAARDDALIDVGDGHDELDVVLGDERGERREVARVVDPGDERHVIRVVERGSQAVEVGCDRRRPGPLERGHDVDALPGAGEENRCHGGRGYCLSRKKIFFFFFFFFFFFDVAHEAGFQPPEAPLYVPPNRANGVRARIFRSTQSERCSTYQTSSSMRSSH